MQHDQTEIWVPVSGYEGLYSVSNLGRIKSHKTGRLLKQMYDNRGYKRLVLHKNTETKNFRVHRLVALAFIPNPESKSQVNHINGIKDDNRAENLEWVTGKENVVHSYRVLGRKPTKGNLGHTGYRNKGRKLTDDQVLFIRNSNESPTLLGKRYGVATSTICSIRARRLYKDTDSNR